MARCFWLLLIVLGSTLTAYAQPPIPDIAWTVNGELWLAGETIKPFAVAAEGMCCAVFSPQGTSLAYLSDSGQQLWILNTAKPESAQPIESENLPAGALLGYLRWQDENILWLNTFQQPTREDVNLLQTDWKLWRVDVKNGSIMQVSNAGHGGAAYPAPDGEHVAVVYPGEYAEAPAVITLVDQGGSVVGSYEYPAVSSASHLAWLPEIRWVGDAIRFAVPDPDLVYAFEDPLPATRLIEFHPEGGETLLAEITIPYPAHVVWSPDGSQAVYIARKQAGQQIILDDLTRQDILFEDVVLGTNLLEWEHNELTIYMPNQGLVVWADGVQAQIPGVFSAAHTLNGAIVIANSSQILLIENSDQTVIADGMSGFDAILAHGIR